MTQAAQDAILELSTTIQDTALSADGFGTIMIACRHTFWPERVREFGNDLSELITAGATEGSSVYKLAAAVLSQPTKVSKIKIGRRASGYTQRFSLTVPPTADGAVASIVVNGTTVSAAQAAGDKATPFAAALQANAAFATATVAGDVITATAAAPDTLVDLHSAVGVTVLADTTADPGIAADLSTIEEADGDWYGLVIDGYSQAQIVAAAAWVEPRIKVAVFTSQDSETLNAASTTDVGAALNVAGLHRSQLVYHTRPAGQNAGAALMGLLFSKNPGEAVWHGQKLSAVDRVKHGSGDISASEAKKFTLYADVKGIGQTLGGWAASGRFMDTTRGIDAFSEAVAIAWLSVVANSDAIPYADSGAALFGSTVEGEIKRYQGSVISAEAPYTITLPSIASQATNDRALRIYRGAKAHFTLRGGMRRVVLDMTASV